MNFLTAGFPLGRIFRIQVIISWSFLIFAAWWIFGDGGNVALDAVFMALLFAIVLMHEFGHSLTCRAVGGKADHIVLWPLGGLAMVDAPPVWWKWLLTTLGGPAVNAVLAPLCWAVLVYVLPHIHNATAFRIVGNLALFGRNINLLLLFFNLLPVYPMDGGRIVQEILWPIIGYPRSLLVAAMIGTVGGIAFIALGLGLAHIRFFIPLYGPFTLGDQGPDILLAGIGLFAAMTSFQHYRHAQFILDSRR